jgi:hypothetical protein
LNKTRNRFRNDISFALVHHRFEIQQTQILALFSIDKSGIAPIFLHRRGLAEGYETGISIESLDASKAIYRPIKYKFNDREA